MQSFNHQIKNLYTNGWLNIQYNIDKTLDLKEIDDIWKKQVENR